MQAHVLDDLCSRGGKPSSWPANLMQFTRTLNSSRRITLSVVSCTVRVPQYGDVISTASRPSRGWNTRLREDLYNPLLDVVQRIHFKISSVLDSPRC